MTIGWYPGHMATALRELKTVMNRTDVVIEVVDARLPESSANPVLRELRGARPCIVLMNKNDLADGVVTRQWVRHFEKSAGVSALPVDARESQLARKVVKLCQTLSPQTKRACRALVVGIPNVGKSTLINTLAGKTVALVGNKPAVTRETKYVELRNGVDVWDSPGMLWPHLKDQTAAHRLAASGAIGENAYDITEIALFLLEHMVRAYPKLLMARFKLESLEGTSLALLEAIARHRACFIRKGEVDLERAAHLVTQDFRTGKLGHVSLEAPPAPTASMELDPATSNESLEAPAQPDEPAS